MAEPSPSFDAQKLAEHYAAAVDAKSGAILLADLEKRFASDTEPVFVLRPGMPYDPIEAAVREGRRQVVAHIRHTAKQGRQKEKAPKQTKAKR